MYDTNLKTFIPQVTLLKFIIMFLMLWIAALYLGETKVDTTPSISEAVVKVTKKSPVVPEVRSKNFVAPLLSQPYKPFFTAIEKEYDLPLGFLTALAYKESSFSYWALNCEGKGRAGEKGIFQIIPKWHPTAKPCDPVLAGLYVAKWIKMLETRYGSLTVALYAYNWGPGNVALWRAGKKKLPYKVGRYAKLVLAYASGSSA